MCLMPGGSGAGSPRSAGVRGLARASHLVQPRVRALALLACVLGGAATSSSSAACPPLSVADGGGGCVLCDCDGACYDARGLRGWAGDGTCDSARPNLNCWAFAHDGGDCEAPEQAAAGALVSRNTFKGPGLAVDAADMDMGP